jgi:ParB/RepB/Spo0J family partition protein
VPRRTLGAGLGAVLEHRLPNEHRRRVRADARRAGQPTEVVWLRLEDIAPSPEAWNSRTKYDDASISELAASLEASGVMLNPIAVRPFSQADREVIRPLGINGVHYWPSYVIVAGNRRYYAAKKAQWSEVPCIVHMTDIDRGFVLNVQENLARQELSGAEKARAIALLAAARKPDGTGWGVREIARNTGFNEATISRWLNIHRRPAIRDALIADRIDVTQTRRAHPELVQRQAASLTQRRVLDALQNLNRIDSMDIRGPEVQTLATTGLRVLDLLGSDPGSAQAIDMIITHALELQGTPQPRCMSCGATLTCLDGCEAVIEDEADGTDREQAHVYKDHGAAAAPEPVVSEPSPASTASRRPPRATVTVTERGARQVSTSATPEG